MRVVIDLCPEGDPHGAAKLPTPTVLRDDGEIVLCFVDTEIRMSYGQFEDLFEGMREFREGTTGEATVYDEDL
jgi:hypothetical protein